MLINESLVTVEPTIEPVTLDEVKVRARVDLDDAQDDDLLTALAISARKLCEEYMGRAILPQTRQTYIELTDDHTQGEIYGEIGWRMREIEIPFPITSAVSSIEFESGPGEWTVLDTGIYYLDLNAQPARLWMKPFFWWFPLSAMFVYYKPRIRVTHTCGYSNISNVPQMIKEAVKTVTMHLYDDGQPMMETVTALLDPYKIVRL